jgi:transposase
VAGLNSRTRNEETILTWYRKLIAKKFDGSAKRGRSGRPRVDKEVEKLVLRMVEENPTWGYDRVAGALSNLGHDISDETVGNILKRNGVPPEPRRKPDIPWSEFIERHQDVIAACDFFTAEVLTPMGLMTYYVLFFIKIGSREVHIAGLTQHPNESWMRQVARNVTMEEWGFLCGQRYLIFDRDSKFCASFRRMIRSVAIETIRLPHHSPNLNAYAERYVRSVKEECLSRIVPFGEEGLRKALNEFVAHYHKERNHQGKDNVLLFPSAKRPALSKDNAIACKQRLGGMLKYYYRDAA